MARLAAQGYVADIVLSASLHLMTVLDKPLLLEGEAGVGKTDIAKCLAQLDGRRLIRLQCYEGLDATQALYDWDYQRQLLTIQLGKTQTPEQLRKTIYSEEFLVKRPLLEAILSEQPVVLLIDEVDRADEAFEALLLEVLSDFQISVPELGTFNARQIPRVILTSNGVRELSDALRRRCLYHYVDYPDAAKELAIIRARLPDVQAQLAVQIVDHVQKLRHMHLRKAPGIAETLDWARALLALKVTDLRTLEDIDATLGCLVKTQEDLALLSQSNQLPAANEGNSTHAG